MAGWHMDFAVIFLSLYGGELCTATDAQVSSPLCCLINSNSNWSLGSKSVMQWPKVFSLAFLHWSDHYFVITGVSNVIWILKTVRRYAPLLHATLDMEKCGYIRKCPCHIPLFCQYQWSIISCRYGDGCSFFPPQPPGLHVPPYIHSSPLIGLYPQ